MLLVDIENLLNFLLTETDWISERPDNKSWDKLISTVYASTKLCKYRRIIIES